MSARREVFRVFRLRFDMLAAGYLPRLRCAAEPLPLLLTFSPLTPLDTTYFDAMRYASRRYAARYDMALIILPKIFDAITCLSADVSAICLCRYNVVYYAACRYYLFFADAYYATIDGYYIVTPLSLLFMMPRLFAIAFSAALRRRLLPCLSPYAAP